MKYAIRLLTILLFLAGCLGLGYLSKDNHRLAEEINRLEAELGRMSILDDTQVHLVEVESPNVPPEVASHVVQVWQFRCYLPPGYDYLQISGSGRVTKEGIYQSGGYSVTGGPPKSEAIHQLLTVSLHKSSDTLRAFYAFGGSSSITAWNGLDMEDLNNMVVQKLVSSEKQPRSFDQDTILPLLKIYDPSTAEDNKVAGKSIATYAGGMIILCPKSREPEWKKLRLGETPDDFDPACIAMEAGNE